MNHNAMLILESPESVGETGNHFNVVTAYNDMAAAHRQTKPGCGVRQSMRKKILIVDDELDLWWGFVFKKLPQLALAHYEIDFAKDGEDGWPAIQAKYYDLLITDNRMPGMSGLELIAKMRSAGIALPVILASSLVPVEELKRRPHLKIADTLEKPVTAAELSRRIDRILSGSERSFGNAVSQCNSVVSGETIIRPSFGRQAVARQHIG